jgi:C1A family cysteine protease
VEACCAKTQIKQSQFDTFTRLFKSYILITMKNLNRNIKAEIILVLVFLLGLFTFAYADPNLAPLNPDFQTYLQNLQKVKAQKLSITQKQIKNVHPLGLIPLPVDLSHMKGQSIVKQGRGLAATVFSATYDLRSQGKLTPIKDQILSGPCWAFATYGSLESCLLPAETRDYSENNLVNLAGFDNGFGNGGNYAMSTAYLSRWGGPVNESDDPFPHQGGSSAGLPVQKHVQEVLFIPDRGNSLDNDNIKQMIITYGAVMTSMYYPETNDSAYYNSTNHAFYYYGTTTGNHAVAIVGWNDNYDKNKFVTAPQGNGAFIVRNSWGTGWGESGYFYISYYDSKIGKANAVFDVAESTGNYDKIYQYDPLGWNDNLGNNTTTGWFANVFTATSNEQLKAVGFYSFSVNSSYEISVYSNFNGASFSGLLGSKIGTISIAGYHTIQLDRLISISSGNKICVVVKLTTPGFNYPITIECPITNHSSQAIASAGQSYISSNGNTWSDITTYYANTNVCLKAYTIVPTAASIMPNRGANTGQVSITNLAGTRFTTGASVKLSKSGQNDINATGITVVSPTKITCALDLNGKAPGSWDVVVSTGGTGSVLSTLSNGFIVVSSITVSSITPASAYNNDTLSITNLAGAGFVTGSTLKIRKSGQNDISATNVTVISPSQVTCMLGLVGKVTGYWDVVVSTGGAGSTSATLKGGLFVQSSDIKIIKQLDDSLNSTVILKPVFGDVRVDIPAGSFGQNVALTLSTATVSSTGQPALRVTNVGIDITNDHCLQPCMGIAITLYYRDSDIVGFDKSKLTLAYYDVLHNRWVTIPSTVYPSQNKIIATVKHLTRFAIVQLTPAADNSEIKGYPIPYNPNKGMFTFDNLPANAEIRIFTVGGELVCKVSYVNASGRTTWDGKNDNGNVVASGVYVVLVKSDSGKKIIKIAVEK